MIDNSGKEWDFFISYAKEDLEKAEALYALLMESTRVFLNTKSSPSDTTWGKALREAVEQSTIVVPLMSSHSPTAHYQEDEVTIAIESFRKDPARHSVIPVHLEDPSTNNFKTFMGLNSMLSFSLSIEKSLEKIALRLMHALHTKSNLIHLMKLEAIQAINKLDFSKDVNRDISEAKNVTILANWLPQWIHNASLETALSNGATVSLIFMQRTSQSLAQRSIDLGHEADWGAGRLHTGFDLLKELFQKVDLGIVKKNLSVRLHNCLPSALIIRCDNNFYLGEYFHGMAVSDSFIFRIRPNAPSFLVEALNRELASMIQHSSAIDLMFVDAN